MIIDIFPFFNELDLLEVRLEEHNEFVDKFILIEAHQTHTGNPKPLYYYNNENRFEKFKDKITHLAINLKEFPASSGYPNTPSWKRENYQRNYGMEWLLDQNEFNIKGNDIVISSDLDEIINKDVIDSFIKSPVKNDFYTVTQNHYAYKLNLKCDSTSGPRIGYWNIMKQCDLSSLRTSKPRCTLHGGWHFSFLSKDKENVYDKFQSFAHRDDNPWAIDPDSSVEQVFKWLVKQKVNLDNTYPKFIRNNIEKFTDYLWVEE